MIRDATSADFPAILALNAASVAALSPLDAVRLADLHTQAAYHRVIASDAEVMAFLLVLGHDAAYDSPNFRWFAERGGAFLYVDRVVVGADHRRRGLAGRLYADLFAFAGTVGIPTICCEFDLDPPNEASARFHARFGFREVGRKRGIASKLVSLQEAPV